MKNTPMSMIRFSSGLLTFLMTINIALYDCVLLTDIKNVAGPRLMTIFILY